MEQVKRKKIKQRKPRVPLGARQLDEDNNRIPLVDLSASDGGFEEWRSQFWAPMIEGGISPEAATQVRAANSSGILGAQSPIAMISGLFKKKQELI